MLTGHLYRSGEVRLATLFTKKNKKNWKTVCCRDSNLVAVFLLLSINALLLVVMVFYSFYFFRLQMVSVEDKLFAIGGLRDVFVRDPFVPFVQGFSGQNNTWNAIDHQPSVQDVELDSFCAVFTGRSSVLMTGGLDPRTNKCTSHVCSIELKDIPSSMIQLTSLICPRAGHCQVLAGDYVYAFGGFQTPHTHVISDVIRSVEC